MVTQKCAEAVERNGVVGGVKWRDEEVKEVEEVKEAKEKTVPGGLSTTHPPGVFWKCVQGKELAEGVCEICVDKGLTGAKREIEGSKDVREGAERGGLAFIVRSLAEALERGAKK